MKSYHHKFVSDHPLESTPMAEIDGFPVRPGIFDLNGATPVSYTHLTLPTNSLV